MTPGQLRVAVLLALLGAIQAAVNPNVRRILTGHLNPDESKPGALGIPKTYLAGYIGIGAGVVVLVALAEPAPKLATWIVVIFIALALIQHSSEWTGLLNEATAGAAQLAKGNFGGAGNAQDNGGNGRQKN